MNTKIIKKSIMTMLLIVAIGFLYNVGVENYNSIKNEINNLNTINLIFSLVCVLLMLFVKAVFHILLINDFLTAKKQFGLVLNSYAQSQIIRYLPGKVLGIIFQGERLGAIIERKIVWLVNLWQMLITNINGIGIIIFVILYFYFNLRYQAIIALVTCVISYILFRFNFVNNLIYLINKIKYFNLEKIIIAKKSSAFSASLKSLLLQLDWVFYFIFWYFILPESFSTSDFLVLGSIYAGASLVGLAVLVVPSGWFVREASFIWFGLSLGYAEEMLFFLSILVRLVTILGDLVFALLASFSIKIIEIKS